MADLQGSVSFHRSEGYKAVKDDPINELVREQEPLRIFRSEARFSLSPGEQLYAEHIAREIEATWGYERMPPELEKTIVPDVGTNLRGFGEATLHDCLFSDHW